MKKIAVVLAVAVLALSLVSFSFAADATVKGVVKSVDAKAGTVVITADGKDMNLKADKDVDLEKVKAGSKVEATVDGETLKSVKAARKAAVGC